MATGFCPNSLFRKSDTCSRSASTDFPRWSLCRQDILLPTPMILDGWGLFAPTMLDSLPKQPCEHLRTLFRRLLTVLLGYTNHYA